MSNKKQDRRHALVLLCAIAVSLLCLFGVFVLLWQRRNDRPACRPQQHYTNMENYGNSEPNQSITGQLPHLEEGCWKIMPTGCETNMPEGFFRDQEGDANADLCATRKADFNQTCMRNDAGWLYAGPEPVPPSSSPSSSPSPSPSSSPSPSPSSSSSPVAPVADKTILTMVAFDYE